MKNVKAIIITINENQNNSCRIKHKIDWLIPCG